MGKESFTLAAGGRVLAARTQVHAPQGFQSHVKKLLSWLRAGPCQRPGRRPAAHEFCCWGCRVHATLAQKPCTEAMLRLWSASLLLASFRCMAIANDLRAIWIRDLTLTVC